MIEFRVVPHIVRPDTEMVAVFKDDVFIATVTPDDSGSGIRINSTNFEEHVSFTEVPLDDGTKYRCYEFTFKEQ